MHYKNGREAKVGDPVVGTTYNVPGIHAGTLVTLTQGDDACSCKVGMLMVQPIAEPPHESMSIIMFQPVRVQGDSQHGSGGNWTVVSYNEDYSQCSNLLHAEDAFKDS